MTDLTKCECDHVYDKHDKGGPCTATLILAWDNDGTHESPALCRCVHFEADPDA